MTRRLAAASLLRPNSASHLRESLLNLPAVTVSCDLHATTSYLFVRCCVRLTGSVDIWR